MSHVIYKCQHYVILLSPVDSRLSAVLAHSCIIILNTLDCFMCSELANVVVLIGLARRPPKECFEEVSIDYSCTGVLDEGSAAICVGDQTPDAQIGAWIATAVLATTVIALVVIGAVVTVRIMKQ